MFLVKEQDSNSTHFISLALTVLSTMYGNLVSAMDRHETIIQNTSVCKILGGECNGGKNIKKKKAH